MLLRQKADGCYSYPEHRRGVGGVIRRILWKLGFDPLTVYERLHQADTERKYWYEKARRYAGNTDFWRSKVEEQEI